MCIYECENVLQIAHTSLSIIPSKFTILVSIGLIEANTGNHGARFTVIAISDKLNSQAVKPLIFDHLGCEVTDGFRL